MRRKSGKSRKKWKYNGGTGTRKRPLERGLRRVTLPVPKIKASGAFKTIWKVKGSRRVVINSTLEQTEKDKTPYRTQLQEFAFSKKMSTFFPQFFPEVSFFKGDEKELEVIDQLRNSKSADKRLKYIWLKEDCPPPSDEEIQHTYLKKAIQLLVDLMKQGLCYIDIKPMNIGKRGDAYVVIDTDPEDIYFVPSEYQIDYLKGEILICGMSVYHYLKDLKVNHNKTEFEIPYDKILQAFSLAIIPTKEKSIFEHKLQSYLKGETIEIPKNIEKSIKSVELTMYRNYLGEDEKQAIRNENNKKSNNQDDFYTISARLDNYASMKKIGQFFRDEIKDEIKDKSTPLLPSSLDFLNE